LQPNLKFQASLKTVEFEASLKTRLYERHHNDQRSGDVEAGL
jgi:hypothetical protein